MGQMYNTYHRIKLESCVSYFNFVLYFMAFYLFCIIRKYFRLCENITKRKSLFEPKLHSLKSLQLYLVSNLALYTGYRMIITYSGRWYKIIKKWQNGSCSIVLLFFSECMCCQVLQNVHKFIDMHPINVCTGVKGQGKGLFWFPLCGELCLRGVWGEVLGGGSNKYPLTRSPWQTVELDWSLRLTPGAHDLWHC